MQQPETTEQSRRSGRPAVKGHTPDGRYIFVAYAQIDDMTVDVVSAYEVDD